MTFESHSRAARDPGRPWARDPADQPCRPEPLKRQQTNRMSDVSKIVTAHGTRPDPQSSRWRLLLSNERHGSSSESEASSGPATDGRAVSSSVLLRPTASLQAYRAPGLVLAGLRVGFKSRDGESAEPRSRYPAVNSAGRSRRVILNRFKSFH